MTFYINLLLLVSYFLVSEAFPNSKLDGKVIGGQSTNPASHPYLVSLQMRFFMVRAHVCGGTLLNENWESLGCKLESNKITMARKKSSTYDVPFIAKDYDYEYFILSAAHCVKGSFLIKWLPLDAIAGASNAHDVQSVNFGPGAQIATVDKRIPHPDYSGGIQPNDIAVLHTSTPFRFTKDVKPALLPIQLRSPYEQPLKLAGWGILKTTFFFPDLPRHLQEANVTYLPYADCYEAVEAVKSPGEVNPLDEQSNICTGPITGGVSACSGDSGGPLIQFAPKEEENSDDGYTDDNDIEDQYPLSQPKNKVNQMAKEEDSDIIPIVIGVVSWGASPCGEKGAPTVYTKVEKFIDFINKYVQ